MIRRFRIELHDLDTNGYVISFANIEFPDEQLGYEDDEFLFKKATDIVVPMLKSMSEPLKSADEQLEAPF
jgi:hypothetical protein